MAHDIVMGIPHLILLILISNALGRGTLGVLVGVSLTHWPSLSRVLRAEMLQVSAQPFMACSCALGVSRLRLAVTHLVPHVLPQYLIGLVLLFPHAVLHQGIHHVLGVRSLARGAGDRCDPFRGAYLSHRGCMVARRLSRPRPARRGAALRYGLPNDRFHRVGDGSAHNPGDDFLRNDGDDLLYDVDDDLLHDVDIFRQF